MKLKALSTIIGADDKRASPGQEFSTLEFGIDTAEATALIARGFAAEATEEKPLTPAQKKAAEKAAAEAADAADKATKEQSGDTEG